MSLPQKRLRKIVVAGTTYEWLIRKKPTTSQKVRESSMTMAIQLKTDSERCLLLVDFVISRPDNSEFQHQTGVNPKLVQVIIESALEAGWVPNQNGPTFNHRYTLIKDRPYYD